MAKSLAQLIREAKADVQQVRAEAALSEDAKGKEEKRKEAEYMQSAKICVKKLPILIRQAGKRMENHVDVAYYPTRALASGREGEQEIREKRIAEIVFDLCKKMGLNPRWEDRKYSMDNDHYNTVVINI